MDPAATSEPEASAIPHEPDAPPTPGSGTVPPAPPAPPAGRARSTLRRVLRDPESVLWIVLLLSFALRLVWLTEPGRRLIFDEAFYVNASRVILGWEAGTKYADRPPFLDPNTEHPPLGKLLIAASMTALGDNGIGWRLPSVLAAMLALIAVYRIVRALHPSRWLAVLVVALLSLENLTYVHGRIATLDMLALAPMLIGAWLAIERRWVAAGAALGVALLIKLTALYAVGAVLLYVLFTEGPGWWRALREGWRERWRTVARQVVGPVVLVAVTGAVSFGGLWFLDSRYTTYRTPFDHIARMVSYGAALEAKPNSDLCREADSRPWQWLFNDCQITYLRTLVTTREQGEIVSQVARIDFRGAMNPVLLGALPLAALFAAWAAWRTRNALALWALAWGAANYLPYVALALVANRITYIYYMLPVIPAIAVAVALLLRQGGLPRPVQWGFLAAFAAGVIAYFPFRAIP